MARPPIAGEYEKALRVLGRYLDQQQPRDVFLFEQDGAYLVRLLMGARTGAHHVLAEFTPEEIDAMVKQGPAWRLGSDALSAPVGSPTAERPTLTRNEHETRRSIRRWGS